MSIGQPPGGSLNGPNDSELVVEVDAFEATNGTTKRIVIPGPTPEAPKIITVRIPAGVRDHALLRLPGTTVRVSLSVRSLARVVMDLAVFWLRRRAIHGRVG
jgi:hypothetical protein